MYVLDNKNKSIHWNTLKGIYDNINSIEELRDSEFKYNKLNAITYKLFQKNIYTRSEDTVRNLYNLFKNPPLNMNEEDIDRILETKNIKLYINNNKENKIFNTTDLDKIFSTYNSLIENKIKELENTSSYDIVGMIHKSLSPLCYGKRIYNKNDMDQLLLQVEGLNPNKEIKQELNQEEINKKLENLMKKTFNDEELEKANKILEDGNINLVMNMLSNKITSIDLKTFKNLNREGLIAIKKDLYFTLKSKLNENIGNVIKRNPELSKNEYIQNIEKLLKNEFSTKEIYNYLEYVNKNIDKNNEEAIAILNKIDEGKISSDLKKDLINNINSKINSYKSLKNEIINIIDVREQIENIGMDKYISAIKNLEAKYIIQETKANKLELLNIIPKIENNQNEFYKNLLDEYQSLNKDLLESNKDYKENHLNKLNKKYLTNNNEVKNIFKENLNSLLSITDIHKYSLNDFKQIVLLINSDNKTIFDLYNNTNLLKNLENNSLFKNIFKDKYNNLNNDVLDRIKKLYDIIVVKDNIQKLNEKNITLDIEKNIFLTKSLYENSKEINKEFFNLIESKFESLKESPDFKNKENILMGIIINSFDYSTLEFDQSKYNNLVEILKMKKPDMMKNKDVLDTVDKIQDKWLKWSIIYSREIKDVSLTELVADPYKFDFNNYQTLKKNIEEYKQNKFFRTVIDREITEADYKFDNQFLNVLNYYNYLNNTNNKTLNELDTIKLYKHFDSLPKDMKKYFTDACSHFVEAANNSYSDATFKNHYKEFIIKNNNDLYKLIDSTIKTFYYENKISSYGLDPRKSLYILENIHNNFEMGDKNYHKSFADLAALDILFQEKLQFDVKSMIPVVKKVNKKGMIDNINYYKVNYEKYNIDKFDIKDSEIPLLSNKKVIFNNEETKYSYRVLTVKDFDILLAGHKSNCCMYYGGAGFGIYRHIFEKPTKSMLFEVYKEDGIAMANSWVWKQNKQLTFDNIEIVAPNELRHNPKDIIKKAYFEYAFKAMLADPTIEKVSYGTGNGDITDFGISNVAYEKLSNYSSYYGYGDSNNQKILMGDKSVLNQSNFDTLIRQAIMLGVEESLISDIRERYDGTYQMNRNIER